MGLPQAGVQLVADGVSNFLGDIKRAGRAVDDFTGGATKGIGALGEMWTGSLRRIGELGVDTFVDGMRAAKDATADFIKGGISSAGDVEQNLNVLQVVGSATEQQMAAISKQAIALGADLTLPATSAQDASRAMLELAKGGLDVDRTMAAAKGTLQLAAAGQLDAAKAAEITANALNSFNLSGDKATTVADLLSAAAAKSSVEVVDVADSFKMASAVFSAFQGPVVGSEKAMTQLTAAIALLGNAGIKGSDAGTSLKQMMMQLTAPSQKAKEQMRGLYLAAMSTANAVDVNALAFGKASERAQALAGITQTAGAAASQMGDIAYDAAGKMRSMPEIIDLVSKATRTMTDEQRNNYVSSIFGADAARAVITLMKAGPGAIDQMTASISQQGAASQLAGAQMKGWNGVVQGFSSQMETLGLVVGQKVLPFITPLGQRINEALGALVNGDYSSFFAGITSVLQDAMGQVTTFFQQVGAGTSPISPLLDSISKALAPMAEMLVGQASKWFGMLSSWIATNAPPFFAPIIDAVLTAAPQWLAKLGAWMQADGPRFLEPVGTMLLTQATKWLTGLAAWIDTQVPVIVAAIQKWGEQFSTWIEPLIPPMLAALDKVMVALGNQLKTYEPAITEQLSAWADLFGDWIRKEAAPKLLQGAWDLWIDLLNWFVDRGAELSTAGMVWAMHLGAAFVNGVLDIPQRLVSFGGTIVAWLADLINPLTWQAEQLGIGIIDGIARGIMNGVNWLVSVASNMAQAVINAGKWALGIASPSKVFEEIGAFTAQGMQIGLEGGTPAVQGAMTQMASPVAYPSSTSTTINNNQSLNYAPSYGAAMQPSPQRDTAFARSMAAW